MGEGKVYDVTHEELLAEGEGRAEKLAEAKANAEAELLAEVEAEEREWLSADDIHPYKSRVPQIKGKTVSFPKITKFNTYILSHYAREWAAV